jgi:hypothetical protein
MANASYESLLSLASNYMPLREASEVLKRQLAKLNLNPATVSGAEIRSAAPRLTMALGLYITDDGKREEMKNKLSSF